MTMNTPSGTITRRGRRDGARPYVDHEVELSSGVAAADLFHSLGDPTRLAIVRHLSLGEHRVVDLTEHLGLAQSTVSAHLACLRDCGLVTSRPQGRASLFSLSRPELLADLFASVERLLTSTGDAVSSCSRRQPRPARSRRPRSVDA